MCWGHPSHPLFLACVDGSYCWVRGGVTPVPGSPVRLCLWAVFLLGFWSSGGVSFMPGYFFTDCSVLCFEVYTGPLRLGVTSSDEDVQYFCCWQAFLTAATWVWPESEGPGGWRSILARAHPALGLLGSSPRPGLCAALIQTLSLASVAPFLRWSSRQEAGGGRWGGSGRNGASEAVPHPASQSRLRCPASRAAAAPAWAQPAKVHADGSPRAFSLSVVLLMSICISRSPYFHSFCRVDSGDGSQATLLFATLAGSRTPSDILRSFLAALWPCQM